MHVFCVCVLVCVCAFWGARVCVWGRQRGGIRSAGVALLDRVYSARPVLRMIASWCSVCTPACLPVFWLPAYLLKRSRNARDKRRLRLGWTGLLSPMMTGEVVSKNIQDVQLVHPVKGHGCGTMSMDGGLSRPQGSRHDHPDQPSEQASKRGNQTEGA